MIGVPGATMGFERSGLLSDFLFRPKRSSSPMLNTLVIVTCVFFMGTNCKVRTHQSTRFEVQGLGIVYVLKAPRH